MKATKPALNLREELTKAQAPARNPEREFYFTGDATRVAFGLPSGWKPKYVFVDGLKRRVGAAEDFTVSFDGVVYTVTFAVAPGIAADIDVIGVLA